MSSNTTLPKGIVTPLVTFLTPEGQLDAVGTEKLVEYQLGAGVQGLLAVGSTGELGTLSRDQRTRAIELVVEAARGRVPVWAGVAGLSTADAVSAALEAKHAGADALLVLPPMFFDCSDDELKRHFAIIAERTDIPLVAYDAPPRTPRKLPTSVIVELASEGVLKGVKDSSSDLTSGRLMVEALSAEPRFRTYIGSEITIDLAFIMGFDGVIPGFANVLPRLAVDMFVAAAKSAIDTDAQRRYLALWDVLRVPIRGGGIPATAIAALKVATAHMLGMTQPTHQGEPFSQPDASFVSDIVAIVNRVRS